MKILLRHIQTVAQQSIHSVAETNFDLFRTTLDAELPKI